jgi:hypothetical protein
VCNLEASAWSHADQLLDVLGPNMIGHINMHDSRQNVLGKGALCTTAKFGGEQRDELAASQ